MAGIRGTGGEVLEDSVAEGRVREAAHTGEHARRRDWHELRPRHAVIAGPGHVDGLPIVGGRLVGGDRDVNVPGRVHGRVHVLDHRSGVTWRRQGYRLGEALPAIARDGDPDLRRGSVEDRPGRVDVILIAVARNLVDRDPLLVLHATEGLGRRVGETFEGLAAVALHPVPPEVVAVGDADVRVRV